MNPEKDLDIIESCSWEWNEKDKKYTLDEERYFAKEWIGEDLFKSGQEVKFVVHVLSGDEPYSEEFYFYSQAKSFMDEHLAVGDCAVMKKKV